MSGSWQTVQLTAKCLNPFDRVLLLPKHTNATGRAAVRRSGAPSISIVSISIRSDTGTAACAGGRLLQELGGEDASIDWRQAGFMDRLRYEGALQLQLATATVTAIGTVVAAILTFATSTAPTGIATGALLIAAVLAIVRLVGDLSKSQ